MKSEKRFPRRLRRWVLGVGLLVGAAPGLAMAQAPEPADRVQRLEAVYQELEQADRALARESFDPHAILEITTRDPQKLLAWVRDNTYWVPYRGALRGPVGVLNDRVGSSLDRSLLLAELLRLAGHEARLANATLEDAAADGIVKNAAKVPSDWLAPAADGNALADTEFQERQARAIERIAEDLRRLETQSQAVLGAIGERAGQAPASDDSRAAAKDHWWVQIQTPEGQWVDLDPLATEGARFTPARTLPAPKSDTTAGLPDELCHLVDLKIIIEKYDAGQLSEHPVVAHTLRPSEVMDKHVVLSHVPIAWPKELAAADDPEQAKYLDALLKTKEFMPIVYVGDGSLVDNSFSIHGDVNQHPNLDETAKFAGAVGGAFGGLMGGGGGGESTAILTAEWVEYTIRAPGKPDRVIRREVFDLIGPAARQEGSVGQSLALSDNQKINRALAMVAETDILLLPCHPSADFVAHASAKRLLGTRQRVMRAFSPEGSGGPAVNLNAAATSPLWALAAARPTFGTAGGDVYLDTTNIFQFRRAGKLTDDGKLVGLALVDLAANPVAVRPGVSPAEAFAIRVRQGVADTVAEATLLSRDSVAVANTAVLLANQSLAPIGQAPANVAPDAAARVKSSAHDGVILLGPASPVELAGTQRYGWYRVDAATGETIGVMDSGYHASMTERSQIETRVNSLHYNPYNATIADIKSGNLAKDAFIDMMLNGRGLHGLRLHRAFAKAAELYDLLVIL